MNKADNTVAIYRRLREQSLWRLVASDNGPAVIGLLQTNLFDSERRLPASIFCEQLHRDLQDLLALGEDLPRTAQAYVADWLAAGYLERRFPPGASEEEYELSAAAAGAIRFAAGLVEPHTTATESRLAVVIQQLVQLAEETDTNPETRIATLLSERERIDEQIEAIRQGRMQSLPDVRALERVHEIIALADDLASDFRRVRDRFEQLNRDLRERLMDNDASRGGVLEALFAGVDVIAESDAGRTFSAFWRLLTDPEQSSTLEKAIDDVVSRDFAGQLDSRDRRFLLRLTRMLLEQGGMVHEVLQVLSACKRPYVAQRRGKSRRCIGTHRRIRRSPLENRLSSQMRKEREVHRDAKLLRDARAITTLTVHSFHRCKLPLVSVVAFTSACSESMRRRRLAWESGDGIQQQCCDLAKQPQVAARQLRT